MTTAENEFATECNRVQPMSVVEKSQSYQDFRGFTTVTTDFYINFLKNERIERFESIGYSMKLSNTLKTLKSIYSISIFSVATVVNSFKASNRKALRLQPSSVVMGCTRL